MGEHDTAGNGAQEAPPSTTAAAGGPPGRPAGPLRVTLVRHGETYQNRHHVVQGQDPTWGRLTPEGVKQARLLGEAMAHRHFDIVYCSPLERAVLTMSMLLLARPGDRTLPLVFPPELREVNQGVLSGRPQAEWREALVGRDPMTHRAEGGENWYEVQARVVRYFREVILSAGHANVLVVAHGGVNRGLLAHLLDIELATSWQGAGVGTPQDNTCVNELVVDRQGNLLEAVVNDTTHLEGHFKGAGPGQRWLPDRREWELLAPDLHASVSEEFDPYG